MDTPIRSVSVSTARAFVEGADIPRLREGAGETVQLAFDTAKNQAVVAGSQVVAFVKGVTSERREAIANSALLAQLVAKKKVPNPNQIYDWYDAYFEALANLGWVIQSRDFAEYHEESENFEAHEAILKVATALLAPTAPAALALVKTTLDALKSMDSDNPWITIFSRESRSGRTARFQVSLAEQADDGQFLVTLMAFGLEATSTITQVLFFKVRANEAKLRHYSGSVTINTGVLEAIRENLNKKLAGIASDYLASLPDL